MKEEKAIKLIDSLLTNQLILETIRQDSLVKAKKILGKFSYTQEALKALKEARDDGYVITLSLSDWMDEISNNT
jgi:hypothetical protein